MQGIEDIVEEENGDGKVNHIYLMPFPRKEFALYVDSLPADEKTEEAYQELKERIDDLVNSKNPLKRFAGKIVEDKINDLAVESQLVRAMHNGKPVVIHYPTEMYALDAYVQYDCILQGLMKKAKLEMAINIGGSVVSAIFQQWWILLGSMPMLSKQWREGRAYETLLVDGWNSIPWDECGDDELIELNKSDECQVPISFKKDERLQGIVDYLTLPEGRIRRYRDLIRFCGKDENLKEFTDFYNNWA